ncbi:MAG: TetR family transcriptional regulator, partial [Mycobacteriaceae bacterium]|nr:TetR family transcriptional regulator [Mycobacteriaceae bacterium]
EIRAFAGAMTGAMLAVVDRVPVEPETIYRALEFLEAGMPLD